MLRVLDLPADGSPAQHEDRERLAPPPEGIRRWIDVEGEGLEPRDLLEILRQRFGLHPLAIEDCISFDQRAPPRRSCRPLLSCEATVAILSPSHFGSLKIWKLQI